MTVRQSQLVLANEILHIISELYGVDPQDVIAAGKSPALANVRKISARIMKVCGTPTLIVSRTLNRDHSTVWQYLHEGSRRAKYDRHKAAKGKADAEQPSA